MDPERSNSPKNVLGLAIAALIAIPVGVVYGLWQKLRGRST